VIEVVVVLTKPNQSNGQTDRPPPGQAHGGLGDANKQMMLKEKEGRARGRIGKASSRQKSKLEHHVCSMISQRKLQTQSEWGGG
jgi:hypothetical protein